MAPTRRAMLVGCIVLMLGVAFASDADVPAFCNAYSCHIASCSALPACAAVLAGEHCSWWCNSWTSGMPHCAGCSAPPQPISYTYVSDVMLSPSSSIRVYEKIESASCGYADLTGFVVSDPTVFTELGRPFYGFYPGTSGLGYVTDPAMSGPDACAAYCAAEATCALFYYQYEYTLSSRMAAASLAGRWMHKCQLTRAFEAGCGSPYAGDANEFDEYAGRVSAAGAK